MKRVPAPYCFAERFRKIWIKAHQHTPLAFATVKNAAHDAHWSTLPVNWSQDRSRDGQQSCLFPTDPADYADSFRLIYLRTSARSAGKQILCSQVMYIYIHPLFIYFSGYIKILSIH